MPNAKGRVPKSKAKAKPKEDNDEENNVIDTDMAVEQTAQDVEENEAVADDEEEDTWQTKAELEAIEAEINAESLVLTKAKSSREPPPSLILPLLPYQKEFLSWAIEQETGPVRGGILADEMGLGKTLQAVSLIVTHPREGQILGPDDGAPAVSTVPTVAPPSMKLKLPSHLATQNRTSNPGSQAKAKSIVHNSDCAEQEPCKSSLGELPLVGPNADEKETGGEQALQADQVQELGDGIESRPQADAGSSKALISQAPDAACTEDATAGTPPAKPAKGKAKKAGKAKAAKAGTKGKAVAVDAEPTTAPETPAPAPAPADEGGDTPATGGSGGKGKGKKSPKTAKVKKARVDPMVAAMEQAKVCRVEAEEGGDKAFSNTTLVVSPVVAAMQWRQEILRYMAPGSINVVLYYGTNRADTFTQKQLESADIVLTTYSILEVDYRRNIMAPKATCTFCGKKFQPERLKVHLRYFCGPWAEKTEAQARQQKKRAPWMMRRGGGGGGKGKGDSKPGKGKGSAGAGTSAAAEADASAADGDAAAAEASMDADEVEAQDTDMDSGGEEVKATKAKARPAAASKGKSAGKKVATGAAAKGKAASKTRDDAKAGKSVKATEPKVKKAAGKKRKTAAAQDVASAPPAADDERPETPPAADAKPAGKVTRSRAASRAAAAAIASSGPAGDTSEAEPSKPARKTRGQAAAAVGTKRKRAAVKKPAAKKGRAAAKRGGSDSDASSADWAPESDDEQQAALDAVASESELSNDEAALSEENAESEATADADEEDDDVVVVDDEEVPGRGKGKSKGKGKKKKEEDEEDAQLEREVEAAAAKMIAKAQRERDKQVQGESLLHQIRWRRVVLDEAHCIKDRRCNTAQAAFALTARYRWCLTGTPLQNRVNELYSLIRFLRLHPFSHYFADKTQCCSLDFPFKNDLRRCDLCGV